MCLDLHRIFISPWQINTNERENKQNIGIMVLQKVTMHSGAEKPKLRAVMLQNVAGLHYIYLTAAKPPANTDSLSVPALTGKYDFYFTVGFPVY